MTDIISSGKVVKSVQRGVLAMSNYDAVKSATFSEVDPQKSKLVFNEACYHFPADNFGVVAYTYQVMTAGYIASSTSATFRRGGDFAYVRVYWQIIEFV